MALREPFMVHTTLGAVQVELTPPEGEAYLITDIKMAGTGDNYATITVDRATVGYFRQGMTLGSHLAFSDGQQQHSHGLQVASGALADQTQFKNLLNAGGVAPTSAAYIGCDDTGYDEDHMVKLTGQARPGHMTILAYLRQKGLFHGYPVPSGKTFKIGEIGDSTSWVIVEYQVWDARDVPPNAPNGPEAKEFIYLNYGTTGGTINTAGPHTLDTSDSPGEFPAFPFGSAVPAQTEIDLLGILASDVQLAEATASAYAATKYLKLRKDRRVLFDKSTNGLPYIGGIGDCAGDFDRIGAGYSIGGNYSDVDPRPPLMFDPPVSFKSGEELNVTWELAVAGSPTGLLVADQQVAFIQRVRRR